MKRKTVICDPGKRVETPSPEQVRQYQEQRLNYIKMKREANEESVQKSYWAFEGHTTGREYIQKHPMFEEVDPICFYREIFRDGLEAKPADDEPFTYGAGDYCAIMSRHTGKYTEKTTKTGKKYQKAIFYKKNVYDDLDPIADAIDRFKKKKEYFDTFIAPVSFISNSACKKNARFLFAMVIEVDDLVKNENDGPSGIASLFYQIATGFLPIPSYVVSSSKENVHLYYILEEALPLYALNYRKLAAIRKQLENLIWNNTVTNSYEKKKVQHESVIQKFRVPGTSTKARDGEAAIAFKFGNGDPVTIEYLASFCTKLALSTKNVRKKPKFSYQQMLKAWPEWTERHFTKNGLPIPDANIKRKFTPNKRAMYDYFKTRVAMEVQAGNRYKAILCLASNAQKCQISYEELEKDALELLPILDERSVRQEDGSIKDGDHFTEDDVLGALEKYFSYDMRFWGTDAMRTKSSIDLPSSERKNNEQAFHLKLARAKQEEDCRKYGTDWRYHGGAPTKQATIQEWRKNNPAGRKADCIRETGFDKKTVYKWWGDDIVK